MERLRHIKRTEQRIYHLAFVSYLYSGRFITNVTVCKFIICDESSLSCKMYSSQLVGNSTSTIIYMSYCSWYWKHIFTLSWIVLNVSGPCEI